jgi:hypothetical protein
VVPEGLRGEISNTRNVDGEGVRSTRRVEREGGSAVPEGLRGEGVRSTRKIER